MTHLLRLLYLAAIVGVIVFAVLQYGAAVLACLAFAILFGAAELWFDRDGRREDRLRSKAYEFRG